MGNIGALIKRAIQTSSIAAVAKALSVVTAQRKDISVKRVVVSFSVCCVALFGSPATWSQKAQRTKIAFEVHEQKSQYTQQHTLDVGDMPGHTTRLFELHRTFPGDPPAFAGVAIKDFWARGESESPDGNGPVFTFAVFNMANGDKIFGRFDGIAQATAGQSADRGSVVGNLVLTGGTERCVAFEARCTC